MIKHIVMFRLKEENKDQKTRLVDALRGMGGKIETLKHLEVGVDFSGSDRSYDLVLTTHFDDKKGLQTYSTHPVHLPVVELVRSLCSGSVVVDYETE